MTRRAWRWTQDFDFCADEEMCPRDEVVAEKNRADSAKAVGKMQHAGSDEFFNLNEGLEEVE